MDSLAEVETEDVVVDPVVAGAGRVGNEVEALGKFHRVGVVVDDEVAVDGDENAVGGGGESGLAIASDDLMLDFLERKLLWRYEI